MGDKGLENSLVERDVEVLVDSKLSMNQQHVLEANRANHVVGYIEQSIASWSREVVLLYAGAGSLCAVWGTTI